MRLRINSSTLLVYFLPKEIIEHVHIKRLSPTPWTGNKHYLLSRIDDLFDKICFVDEFGCCGDHLPEIIHADGENRWLEMLLK